MTVLVTNARSRIAYNITKSIGKKGIKVHTADSTPLSMSFYSRYSKSHFIYPSPYSRQDQFIDCLIEKIKEQGTEVLLPVYEETYLISKFKDKLTPYVKMVLPDYSQILIAHNKDRWLPIARRLSIPVPPTTDLSEIRKDPTLIDRLKFPLILKPKQGGGGWGIRLLNHPEEIKELLCDKYHHELPLDRLFVQEKIDGPTICVAILFRHGEPRAKVAYELLREYPIGAGQATLRVTRRNENAERYFTDLLRHLEWHGICQADFVLDKGTGIPYLVDINPRFWGSVIQGIASGVDFPYLAYQIAVHGDVEPVHDFKSGVVTRWIGGDLRTFFPLLEKSHDKMRFVLDFFGANRRRAFYDDLSLSDPVPFFCWLLEAFLRIVRDRSFSPEPHDSLTGVWK